MLCSIAFPFTVLGPGRFRQGLKIAYSSPSAMTLYKKDSALQQYAHFCVPIAYLKHPMMKLHITLSIMLLLVGTFLHAQTANLSGQLQTQDDEAVVFANVVLYNAADSSIVKVEASDETGAFRFRNIPAGKYLLQSTYVGSEDLWVSDIELAENDQKSLGVLKFGNEIIELKEATVSASRVMLEVKSDRTVFNVEGTINSVGSDALSLMRKAPGVTVDNNNNISMLGRAGVLIYVDGKRLPIGGDDLSSYLENLPAEQIDRIDIITSPGARYEAEGNAGIIDIRLKKDQNQGANGTVNGTYSQGRFAKYNVNGSGNFRNSKVNVFGSAGTASGRVFNNMVFESYQNGLFMDEINQNRNEWDNYNYRLGVDFFLGKKHTLGVLIEERQTDGIARGYNRIEISPQATPDAVDSILVATNISDDLRTNNTYNLNYRYDIGKGNSLNIDLDYGRFQLESDRFQPNQYFDADEDLLLTEVTNSFDTPSDVKIYTAKVDYEQNVLGGKLGVGSKVSIVNTDNTFLFFDVENGEPVRNNQNSNEFTYEENVYAGYMDYSRAISEKWNFSIGLRAEQTDILGTLTAFDPSKQEPPVDTSYLSWFPNAGLTWQAAPKHTFALNYGRRINRPDYNVLNPFNNRLSELSYEKGNPFLSPEIVNNLELGYTWAYRYNFKLGYSKTLNQITRLIAPDDIDPRAGFITWDNLAEQTIVSFNISAPVKIVEGWDAYFNAGASYLDNQADYGNGAVVDLQAFTYNIYTQHTISLPYGFKGEVSGYYSGPGVWGGVFEYESNWSLNLGLQRKFFNEQLNVRLSGSDLFYQTGWDGESSFDGLLSSGSGRWDSRRFSMSISYRFGNQNIKSRKRKTGLEDEAGRVGG
jgi:iron complex outermembrane receptor protein